MRFVIYGAGGIGGTIGAALYQAGQDVILIARGRHLEALQRDGLRFRSPDGEEQLAIPAHGSPQEVGVERDDVVMLTMKSQDSAAALEELAASAPPEITLVCAQNGVDNERLALRRFAGVYGMLVYLPAEHIEPGVVECFESRPYGVLDLGLFPAGSDAQAGAIADALDGAGISSRVSDDIMRWKYAKLLRNLGNAVQALIGLDGGGDWSRRARAEALDCYRAAGIEFTSEDDWSERTEARSSGLRGKANPRSGGSSWQSLVRGSGSIEADYLNGEIVLLGRLHGIPTPVNEVLARTATRMAQNHEPPGSANPEEVERQIQELTRLQAQSRAPSRQATARS